MNKLPKLILFIALCNINQLCTAQIFDDFSDGNFSVNPTWIGDDSLFTVNTLLQLQSKGTAGTSKEICLATPSFNLLNTEFSCLARFNLNPSTQNFSRFYFASDNPDLKSNLTGYYIQFGGSTGSTDSVTVYKQIGSSRNRILASRPGIVGKNTNLVRVKVLINQQHQIKLYTDTTGNGDYIFEGAVVDSSITKSYFTGVFVKYTSTNINNYFFDDVYIGSERVDTIAPQIIDVNVLNDTLIKVKANEKLSTDILDINKFLVNGARVQSVQFTNQNQNEIDVVFKSLINGSYNTLEAFAFEDISGNMANDTLISFVYFKPNLNDIVISELMADPDPPVGLPNAEYIELYNNAKFPINLSGWSISDPSSKALLPNIVLPPDSFIIICSAIHAGLFSVFGKVAQVNSLPTLNNSGDEIWLRDANDRIINYVNYSLPYYNNSTKSSGGYSLELINPNQLCKQQFNWRACDDVLGGTPGFINSNFSKIEDKEAPSILYANFIDSVSLAFVFSEPIYANNTTILVNGKKENLFVINHDTLFVYLNEAAKHNTQYIFDITGIEDCLKNDKLNTFSTIYTTAINPYQNSLVISEILHSPSTATQLPNAEYIEIYNRSNMAINLQGCTVSDGSLTAVLPNYKLPSDSFVVICSSTKVGLFNDYRNVLGVKNFPSLSATDKVILKDKFGYLLNAVSYTADWHQNKLKQALGGYSIEMLNVNNPCAGQENWRASNNPIGGTPGSANSGSNNALDVKPPNLLRVYPFGSNKINLYFNETLDSLSVYNANINLFEHNSSILSWRFLNDEYNSICLTFEQNFDIDKTYKIVTNKIADCLLNQQNGQTEDFAVLHKPAKDDIVINEVLFNPYVGKSDFVELYNTTNKSLDLKFLLFANANSDNTLKDIKPIAPAGYMLMPNDYVVITPNANHIAEVYKAASTNKIITAALPSMNDDEGQIILMDSLGVVFDRLAYTDKMHNPLLPNKEGVSLEKVNPFLTSDNASNWQSAAASVGFATPTYKNSQFEHLGSTLINFSVFPEVFTPNLDGVYDNIRFNINFKQAGFNYKLSIYNSDGILVKTLANYTNGGTENILFWNGITDNNAKAEVGIYLASLEAFNLNGETLNKRVTFVIGG